ncbi:hypothetical protein [Vibrio zhanjiangensis]|nr:hypothetical protein [Vibrio zhanjiangensis]
MKAKIFVIFLFSFTLFGCVNMQQLDSTNQDEYIVLTTDLTRVRTGGALGIKGLYPTSWVEGVSAGIYIAEGQNSEGVFYRNTKCCIGIENKREMVAGMHGWDCGIWIPNDKTGIVRTYYHDDRRLFGYPAYIGWYAEFTYQQLELSLKN